MMKVIFLCGSLEPGKDGVGDYTRQLSAELIKQGNSAKIISLYDTFLSAQTVDEEITDGVRLPIVRVPANLSWKERMQTVYAETENFDPDLLSLQYVPYSYNKWGTPIRLAANLNKLGRNRWHVMVHEPYIESVKGMKECVVLALQKLSLLFIKQILKPVLFHTSIISYQKRLTKIGIKSKVLELFGNIPIASDCQELRNITRASFLTKNTIKGVYFGTVPKYENHQKIADSLQRFYNTTNANVHLTFCGRNGRLLQKFIDTLMKNSGSRCTIVQRGELSGEDISQQFCSSDFGISRVPFDLIGKSGSVISMLEHGLPVWVPVAGDKSANISSGYKNEPYYENLADILSFKTEGKIKSRISATAKQMIDDISLTDTYLVN